ncbi:hypothetical protein BEN47_03535 [Hymenobacter lapidarius]|uniref:STAS/SEC14 domain-containing protein n=1 Tax=Hymenobacter lapidarius TaxID=1908237 RepID=A0A1G1SXL8_9BACT|nr:hypothetical protein [Hymenobacter lapidarius]OGX83375.1 hypothetical protein BEN47_03535 [Hymenobacter lapidarius]
MVPVHACCASAVLDLHYDDENAWLYLDWKGPQELELVQAACQDVLAFIKQTGARKALNDNTHITETSWDLARWVGYDFIPQVAAAGLEYIAWVCSPLLSCRTNLGLMSSFSDQKPQVAVFDEIAAAYGWLNSVHASGPARATSPSGT